MAEPFRTLLTSVRHNLNVAALEVTSARVTPRCEHAWSVRKVRLHGGRQEGVDLVVIDSGEVTIRLIPTRGMSILDVRCGDVRLGWDSPIGDEVVHPMWVNAHNRNALGWLEGFNEWLVRCGLEWYGAPTSDGQANGGGHAPAGNLTLHGKIANLPASEVEVEVETQAPYRIHVRGRVYERQLFGPKFELTTTLSITPGRREFRVEDRITNLGSQTQEFGLLHHVNYGSPLLEKGSTFVGAVKRVTPVNPRSAEGDVAEYARYGPPQKGYVEQGFLLRLYADKRGETAVMLQNARRDRAVSMRFPVKQLPAFTIWKNTADVSDGYVTGLEPGTNFPRPRPVERGLGNVPKLKGGATFTAWVDFAVHSGKAAVKAVAESIAAIQGGQPTQIDRAVG